MGVERKKKGKNHRALFIASSDNCPPLPRGYRSTIRSLASRNSVAACCGRVFQAHVATPQNWKRWSGSYVPVNGENEETWSSGQTHSNTRWIRITS